jgi:hypothetical protein
MVYSRPMKTCIVVFLATVVAAALPARGQSKSPTNDYSGMYSFLKEGEFIQITIEEKGDVSGFISRYGDTAADKGIFLDQFIKEGKSEGAKLNFTTDSVHGVWFTFEGTFARGKAKTPDEEGYYLLRGTLTRFNTDAENKALSQAREVEWQSFPRDTSPPQ